MIIIETKDWRGDPDCEVILAKLDEGVCRYVTWVRRKDTGEPGDRFWGRYHRQLDDAVADFNAR
jgi:hypothetical protein